MLAFLTFRRSYRRRFIDSAGRRRLPIVPTSDFDTPPTLTSHPSRFSIPHVDIRPVMSDIDRRIRVTPFPPPSPAIEEIDAHAPAPRGAHTCPAWVWSAPATPDRGPLAARGAVPRPAERPPLWIVLPAVLVDGLRAAAAALSRWRARFDAGGNAWQMLLPLPDGRDRVQHRRCWPRAVARVDDRHRRAAGLADEPYRSPGRAFWGAAAALPLVIPSYIGARGHGRRLRPARHAAIGAGAVRRRAPARPLRIRRVVADLDALHLSLCLSDGARRAARTRSRRWRKRHAAWATARGGPFSPSPCPRFAPRPRPAGSWPRSTRSAISASSPCSATTRSPAPSTCSTARRWTAAARLSWRCCSSPCRSWSLAVELRARGRPACIGSAAASGRLPARRAWPRHAFRRCSSARRSSGLRSCSPWRCSWRWLLRSLAAGADLPGSPPRPPTR